MEDKNKELEILIKKENLVKFIKSQRLRWAAHVIRIDTKRTVKKSTEWDPRLSNFIFFSFKISTPSLELIQLSIQWVCRVHLPSVKQAEA
jgi:hypothetical protein